MPDGIKWIKGQLEVGDGGYRHWQLVVALASRCRLLGVRRLLGPVGHYEPTRSRAAEDYVWKDATAVADTRFQLGARPITVSSKTDWDGVWVNARIGNLDSIPARVRVVSYRTLRAIGADYARPVAMVRVVKVFWGKTGTGKSRLAWEEAGEDAYAKDPRTKFWCGYRDQANVIFDEFRGGIDIAHMLRWLDRYPVTVEIKGSSAPLCAKNIWITSNLDPRDWYPDADEETKNALLRRLVITHFDGL